MIRRSKLSIRSLALLLACAGFFLYISGEQGFTIGAFLLVELAAGFLLLYGGNRNSSRAATSAQRARRRARARISSTTRTKTLQKQAHSQKRTAKEAIAKHTMDAVRNAGRNPDESPVRLLDIGLLVYFEGASEPTIYRVRNIPEQAQALRPYAIFHLAERAYGPIRFEIYDNEFQLLFRDEEEHQFEAGKNYRTTRYYLRLRDEFDISDRWCLRMFSGEHAIAYHYFDWQMRIEFNIAADGEVSIADRENYMESEELEEEISLDQLISTIG